MIRCFLLVGQYPAIRPHRWARITFAESKTFSVYKKSLKPHFQHHMPDASLSLNGWILAFLQYLAKLILTEAQNLQQFRRRVKTVSDEGPTQVSILRWGQPSWAVQSLQIRPDLCNLGFIEKPVAIWTVHWEWDSALMWDFCCDHLAGDFKSQWSLKFWRKRQKLKCLFFLEVRYYWLISSQLPWHFINRRRKLHNSGSTQ